MHQNTNTNTNTNMPIIGGPACIIQVSTAQASIHHFEFKSSIMLGYLPKSAQIAHKLLTSTTNSCTRVFSRVSSSQLSLPHQPLLLLHPGRLMSWQAAPHWKCQDPSTSPTKRWSGPCVTGDSLSDGTFFTSPSAFLSFWTVFGRPGALACKGGVLLVREGLGFLKFRCTCHLLLFLLPAICSDRVVTWSGKWQIFFQIFFWNLNPDQICVSFFVVLKLSLVFGGGNVSGLSLIGLTEWEWP